MLDASLPVDSPATGRRSAMHATLSERLAKMDLASKAVQKLGLQNSDLRKLADLGQGNGGSVEKVEHIPTGTIMAKKVRGEVDDLHVVGCTAVDDVDHIDRLSLSTRSRP